MVKMNEKYILKIKREKNNHENTNTKDKSVMHQEEREYVHNTM